MVLYRSLEKTEINTVYQAFLEAFSDYQVQINLPFWKFEQMLQRRGYCAEISLGALEGERLVGFVLNGQREWNGVTTAYDLGTGVIPEYRRQGITSDMLLRLKAWLWEKQIKQYLLEVLTSNQSALKLYQKQGFEVCREFSCFTLDKAKFVPDTAHKVESVESMDIGQCKDFWYFNPSWQNSIASINAVPEAFHYSVVGVDNRIVGYGIIDKKTGDIPQIAVNRAYRRAGIAHSIMAALIASTEADKISLLNVETGSKPIESFLSKMGFEFSVGQYEMLLKL